MENEERFKKLEEAILLMKDLLVSHNDRLDNYFSALENERHEREESRKDFDFKLNALIDAQMRNESDIAELKESAKELNEASKSQLKRIENLENT